MSNPRFFPVREEPMDRDEINRKIQAMIEERNKLYSPTGAVGRTGATGSVESIKVRSHEMEIISKDSTSSKSTRLGR